MPAKKDLLSFQEIKETAEFILKDDQSRKEFVDNAKFVLKDEKKFLFVMIAGLLMLFFGVFSFLGLVIFLISLVSFGIKVARLTLGKDDSIKRDFKDKNENGFK